MNETQQDQLNDQAIKLAGQITDYVNSFDRDKNRDFAKAFCKALSTEHRTLQQSTMRMIMELIEYMASDEYRTDGRNDESKRLAQDLIKYFIEAKKKEFNMPENFMPSQYLSFI